MLRSIVNEIRDHVECRKNNHPLDSFTVGNGSFAFRQSLADRAWSLIAECKLASPSKGILCPHHTVSELAAIFSANGAAALSVHTSHPFLGKISDLKKVRQICSLPLLQKDFIIDEYQIIESRAAGADAILLITTILNNQQLKNFLVLAKQLGMDCLVEIHDQEELNRLHKITEIEWVGINNRNLKTFSTNIRNTFSLLPVCKDSWKIISESGIQSKNDVIKLKDAGVKGALVGESLVTAKNIALQTQCFADPNQGGD